MNNLNRKELESEKKGLFHIDNNSKNLLITFGGVQQGIGMPVFEFFNSVKDIDCDKIFIRDFSQTWYQKGVDDDINHIDILINHLSSILDSKKYNKICFIGNSMGGYAAILIGSILKVDKVLSFAPQTFIDKKNRLLNFDFRWKKEMRNIHSNPNKKSEYFDLASFFKNQQEINTSINLYYSPKHRLDKKHAERLSDFKFIKLIPVNEGGHSIIKTLRDQGELKDILNNLFI